MNDSCVLGTTKQGMSKEALYNVFVRAGACLFVRGQSLCGSETVFRRGICNASHECGYSVDGYGSGIRYDICRNVL